MLLGNERDIEALRAGIREHERAVIMRETTDDIMKREWANEPELVPARLLGVGDKLLACTSAGSFFVDGEVLSVGTTGMQGRPVPEGKLWVTYRTRNGGTGGSTWELDKPILRQFRSLD